MKQFLATIAAMLLTVFLLGKLNAANPLLHAFICGVIAGAILGAYIVFLLCRDIIRRIAVASKKPETTTENGK